MSDRQIRIIPSFTGYKEDVICFETQCGPEEVSDLSLYAFEHHGDAYTPFSPGALRLFHERVLLGQDMPSTLILTRWFRYDQIMAAAIFIQPKIVLEPSCTSLVNSFDLVDRLGPPAFGHVPYEHKELAYMLRNITDQYVSSQVSVEKTLEILTKCAFMLIDYLQNGTLPPIELPLPHYDVLDEIGPFVAFESEDYVWDELYREGYMCGVWFREDDVVVSRKSALTPFLEPSKVLDHLEEIDPAGDWSIAHGAVIGSDTGLDQSEIIGAIKSLLS